MPYGVALYPGATTYPDSTTYPGQGAELFVQPELQFLVSFSNFRPGVSDNDNTIAWEDVTDLVIGSWRTGRGRENELSEINGAVASVTFDNRERFFIPGTSPPLYPSSGTYPDSDVFPGAGSAGPMNRLWVKEFFNAKQRTLFYGYAESYDFGWDFLAERATINASDEFQVLARAQLPKNVPDVESYQGVVEFDNPTGYWRFSDGSSVNEYQAMRGGTLRWAGALPSVSSETPVLGDVGSNTGSTSVIPPTTGLLFTEVESHEMGDANGLTSFSIELWARFNNSPPASLDYLVYGPDMAGSVTQYTLGLNSSGQFVFGLHSGIGYTNLTAGTVLSSSGYTDWHHIVAVKDGTTMRLYQNGVQVGSTGFAGTVGAVAAGSVFRVNGTGGNSDLINYDEVAWYPYALGGDRVAEHYAAAGHGYPLQGTKERLNSILNDVGSVAPRAFRTGKRNVAPVFKHGQDALSEVRHALSGEAGDSIFYFGHDTTESPLFRSVWKLIFLDADHREVPPWNQVQATFIEAGAADVGRGYVDYDSLTLDDSGTFLFNDWTVTDVYGGLGRALDQDSIDRYGWRPRSLNLPIPSPSDHDNIAADMLAKYRYPLERVTSISFDTSVAEASDVAFDLEIGDLVRILHTPSGIDQRSFIQRIELDGEAGRPIRITLGVSPL